MPIIDYDSVDEEHIRRRYFRDKLISYDPAIADEHVYLYGDASEVEYYRLVNEGLISEPYTGPRGFQGEQGVQGPRGFDGPQGPQGIPGNDGAPGIQGIKGDTGATGPQGIQGIQGIKGDKGDKGDTGATGATGATGGSVTIKGTVANQAALPGSGINGDGYITNNDGHLWVWGSGTFTDVGLVRGPQGIQGIQGIQGNTGATGATGPAGPTGPQGPAGTNATTTANATQSTNGLMSSVDKTNLDTMQALTTAVGDIIRKNYVTNTLSTGNYSGTGGTGGTMTLSFQNTLANGKQGFIRATQTVVGTSSSGIATFSGLTPKAVALGDQVTARGWFRTNKSTTTTIQVQGRYRNGSAATAQTAETLTFTNVPANTWVKFNMTLPPATYTADNVYVNLLFMTTSGGVLPALNDYLDWSAFLITDGAYEGDYFDGSTLPASLNPDLYSVGWSGTVGNSVSYLYANADTVTRKNNGTIPSLPPVAPESLANKGYVDQKANVNRIEALEQPVIGFHRSSAAYTGATQFDESYAMETLFQAESDTISYYHPVNDDTAHNYTAEVVPELNKNPNRKLMWALEIHYKNKQFNDEFDAQGPVYWQLRRTFDAVIAGGNMDRVNFAPMHECNGPGGSYDWQMNDGRLYNTTTYVLDAAGSRVNSPALYIAAYKRIVDLARSMGITSKFIQWFLINNSKTNDSAVIEEAIEAGYVGDDYVDIIGVSYYNRFEPGAGASSSSTFTQVGTDIRRFAYRMGQYSSRPIWSCETGCYDSDATDPANFNKGEWYAENIRLVGSGDIPNWKGMIMFLQTPTPTGDLSVDHDYYPENNEQFRIIGRAMRDARRQMNPISRARHNPNLLAPNVSIPSSTSAWTASAAGLSIVTAKPKWMKTGTTSLHISKSSSTGINPEDYYAYHSVPVEFTDWESNMPYTISFCARGSSEKFKLGAGVQNSSGSTFIGEDAIQLQTTWQEFAVTIGNKATESTSWRLPVFRIGANGTSGWAEITNIKIEKGSFPTPNVSPNLIPKSRGAWANMPTTSPWNCEYGDIWNWTHIANRTLAIPDGLPYDGQQITIRLKQDATGGRTLAQSASFKSSSVSSTIVTTAGAVNSLTYEYDATLGKWFLIRNVNY